MDNLITQTEFARMLGISKQRVSQLRGIKAGPPFPEPQKIGDGKRFVLLWPRDVALAYVEARKKYLRELQKGT